MMIHDIVIIGHIAIDTIKLPNNIKFTSLGGPPTYAGFSAKLLNANVAIVSKIGFDFKDEYLLRYARATIYVDYIGKVSRPTTKFEIIYDENWQRKLRLISKCAPINFDDIINIKSKSFLLDPICQEIDEKILTKFSEIKAFKVLDIQGLIRSFDENGDVKLTAFPFDYKLLGHFDVVKVSVDEALKAFNCNNINEVIRLLKEFGVKIIIITLGGKGLIAHFSSKEYFLPAYPVKLVDPTGCGDALLGAFLASYLKTKDVIYSLAIGAASASFIAEAFGSSNFGFKNEVESRARWILRNVKVVQ